MTSENQILNWLMIGISQSPFSLNEVFYLDKSNNEFFSILATDYFMLDEDLGIAKNTTTSYSSQNENSIVNRIQRIENDDKEIIEIPRLSYNERKKTLIEFLDSINDEKEKERITHLYINIESETPDVRNLFNRSFEIESDKNTVEKWNTLKNEILLTKAESFINLNNINLSNVKIWEIEEKGTINIDLTKDDNGKILKQKSNKWWKFWK
ncbi:hypothetical protein [Flavivirga spongiicola]|uniref:Uncharacterized protein n=1 Tax=Flavivirga spongiicola TaxID=421621 RepID=A0ABU7XMT8_9FLAO|nr:hypothetical protein [Flavivirga sp. MEBiC05379]MDO5981736.1 hypothetical protein [Flavivirga sp. MEBiC05379]